MNRSRLWMILAVFFAAVPAYASYYVPPPPIGWEERVTPGYDPGIESVLVRMSRIELQKDDDIKAIWAKWDEGAVDVLLKLFDDKAWIAFRHHVLRLLSLSPCERATGWLDDTFKTLATKSELTKEEQQTLSYLLYSSQRPDAEITRERVELCLREGNRESRNWALGQLINQRTEESLARVTELAKNAENEQQRAWLLKAVDDARGYLRAQEPMEPVGTKGEAK